MNLPEHAECRDGENCTGTGCRRVTGKTKRKNNWARPKFNKHESTRATGAPERSKR